MLSLPYIWTPRKTLWLPGMAINPLGRFGVCANCCEYPYATDCIYCDVMPYSFEVTLDGVANFEGRCQSCVSLNDTFIVSFAGEEGQQCRYLYDSPDTFCTHSLRLEVTVSTGGYLVVQVILDHDAVQEVIAVFRSAAEVETCAVTDLELLLIADSEYCDFTNATSFVTSITCPSCTDGDAWESYYVKLEGLTGGAGTALNDTYVVHQTAEPCTYEYVFDPGVSCGGSFLITKLLLTMITSGASSWWWVRFEVESGGTLFQSFTPSVAGLLDCRDVATETDPDNNIPGPDYDVTCPSWDGADEDPWMYTIYDPLWTPP
jgi:hypothetical protein